eukprot:scaffold75159_cov65-Phaeocystis_antarctica.AAC.2
MQSLPSGRVYGQEIENILGQELWPCPERLLKFLPIRGARRTGRQKLVRAAALWWWHSGGRHTGKHAWRADGVRRGRTSKFMVPLPSMSISVSASAMVCAIVASFSLCAAEACARLRRRAR